MEKICFVFFFKSSHNSTVESIEEAEGLSGSMMTTTTHPIEIDRSFLLFYSYEKANNENVDAQSAAGCRLPDPLQRR